MNYGKVVAEEHQKFHSYNNYLSQTNILETTFRTLQGKLLIQDFMPIVGQQKRPSLYRRLHCSWGMIRMYSLFSPAFEYSRKKVSFQKTSFGLVAETEGRKLSLVSPVEYHFAEHGAESRFILREGQGAWFVLFPGEADFDVSESANEGMLERTRKWWLNWKD